MTGRRLWHQEWHHDIGKEGDLNHSNVLTWTFVERTTGFEPATLTLARWFGHHAERRRGTPDQDRKRPRTPASHHVGTKNGTINR
jgi:hypothetical protein